MLANSLKFFKMPFLSPEDCIPAELAEVEGEEQGGEDDDALWQGHLLLLHIYQGLVLLILVLLSPLNSCRFFFLLQGLMNKWHQT